MERRWKKWNFLKEKMFFIFMFFESTMQTNNNSPAESSGAETTVRVVPGWAEMAGPLSLTTIGQWMWVPQEEPAPGQVSPCKQENWLRFH